MSCTLKADETSVRRDKCAEDTETCRGLPRRSCLHGIRADTRVCGSSSDEHTRSTILSYHHPTRTNANLAKVTRSIEYGAGSSSAMAQSSSLCRWSAMCSGSPTLHEACITCYPTRGVFSKAGDVSSTYTMRNRLRTVDTKVASLVRA